MNFYIFFLIVGFLVCKINARISPLVSCGATSIDVKVHSEGIRSAELLKWSVFPSCQSTKKDNHFVLKLPLTHKLPCGTTKVLNKLTGDIVYYHKLVVTEDNGNEHLFKLTCLVSSNDEHVKANIVKRNVLPAEFVEPDYIEITDEVTGVAPIPEISVGVRQGGSLIGNSVTVSPGTNLSMEVEIDNESSGTYGILVSYMVVTDTADKNETIIFNGCTQDRYIFENFKTTNGDYLSAAFRAFKFPGSTYLLFQGTVDVCIDKCQGILCSNGEIGYGRRRRSVSDDTLDLNSVYVVTMETFIKVDESVPELRRRKEKTPYTVFMEEREVVVEEKSDSKAPFFYFGENGTGAVQSSSFFLVLLIMIARLIE